MKNKQIFSESTPPRHKGLFARFFALFFCLVMGMNVWGEDVYKLVDASGDLTGDFRSGALSSGTYTVDAVKYTQCFKFGSTASSLGTPSDISNKYIVYEVKSTSTSMDFHVWNTNNSAQKLYIWKVEEGTTTAPTATELSIASKTSVVVNYVVEATKQTTIYVTTGSTNNMVCQIVATESGTALPRGGEAGYVMSFNKGRAAIKGSTATVIDGIEYHVNSNYSLLSSSNIALKTKGTNYVKFTLTNAAKLKLTTSSTAKYFVSGSVTGTDNETTPTANEEKEFTLDAGTWYINPNGSNVNITNIAFATADPIAAVCPADLSIPVTKSVTEGDKLELSATLGAGNGAITYQWYKDEVAISGATTKTLTINAAATTDAGSYTCVASKADCSDAQSNVCVVTVEPINWLVRTFVTSATTCSVSGTVAGSTGGVDKLNATPENGGYKLNTTGAYVQVTLGSGYFEPGDKVIAYCTKTGGKMSVLSGINDADFIGGNTDNWVVGENEYVLPETLGENISSIYIARTGTYGQNPYIQWVKVVRPVKHNISYTELKGADNSANPTTYVEGTGVASFAPLANVAGWDFVAWSPASISAEATTDQTITATWTPQVTKYTVTYAKGDEAVTGDVPTQESLAEGANFIVAGKGDLAWTDHKFVGWKDQDDAAVAAGAEYTMPAKDVTLTAQWNVVTTYDVTFNLQGHGAAIEAQHVIEGETAAKPADPKAELYTFGGWYTEAECTNAFDFATTITAAKELFAQWTAFGEATPINIEQFVIDNGKGGDIKAELTAHNFDYKLESDDVLDDLVADESKNDKNCAFRGLKMKHNGSYVVGNIPAGKLIDVVLGNLGSAKVQINGVDAATALVAGAGTTNKTTPDNYKNSHNYYYSETAAVLKVLSTGTSTTVLKAINFLDPFVVTFANGGEIDPMYFKGTDLVLPVATGEGEFQGWYDAETAGTKIGMNGDPYTPTGDITLYAQFSAQSSDNSLKTLKYGETPIEIVADQLVYDVNLPYKSVVPASVTYEANSAVATPTGEQTATVTDGTATFTITAENGDAAEYTVNFTVAPKDGICIIEAALTGATAATVTGAIGGTADVNVTSGTYKMDKGKYIGVALANDGNFQAGDVVVLNVTDKQNATGFALYTEKEGTNLIIDTRDGNVIANGEYSITLPVEYAGSNAIYAVRLNNSSTGDLNACVNNMKVLRAMNPVLTGATILGEAATVNEAAKTVTVEVPFTADITAVTPVFEFVSNDNAQVVVTPAGAQDFSDAKTYRFTDKDGDYTEYEVSITKAEASHDATLSDILVAEVSLEDFDAETLNYTYVREYGVETIPAVEGVKNHSAANVVSATAANVVTLTVTAEDGVTVKEYTVTFTNKAAATDATLKSLKQGGVAIELVAEQYTYAVNLPYGTAAVPALTAEVNEEHANAVVTDAADFDAEGLATSTVVVTAQDGTTELTYTVNFAKAMFPSVVIFDGSTMSDKVAGPDATTGLSWAVVGSTMTAGDKNATYLGTSYTRSLNAGNSSATKHFTITIPENKMGKIHFLTMTNSSGSTRSAWLTASATKGDMADAIVSATSSSYTDLGDATSDWLEEGTYYLHTDNTVNFFVISVEVKAVDPKCEAPVITTQPETNKQFGAGAMTATVVASVEDGGELSYQWYNEADEVVVGATAATLSTEVEGKYYVVITNTLADHRDNSTKSNVIELAHRVMNDATLSALTYGGNAIALVADQYEYDVVLPNETTEVPALDATTNSTYATKVINDAAAFVDYAATSTVVVTAEDGVATQTYTVNFTVKHDVDLQDVTGNMTWDFTNKAAADGDKAVAEADKGNYVVLANTDIKSTFANAEYMAANYNKYTAKAIQATGLKIHTTVPGFVIVTFAQTGNDKVRELYINGVATGAVPGANQASLTYTQFVEAGDVVLTAWEASTSKWQMFNYAKIEFAPSTTIRTGLTVGRMYTTCQAQAITAVDGAEFYEPVSWDGFYLDFVEAEEIKAGYGYMFIATATELNVAFTGEAVSAAEVGAPNGMQGTLELVNLPYDEANPYNLCGITNNHLQYIGANNSMGANRAYVVLDKVGVEPPTAAPSARRVRLTTEGSEVVTGIEFTEESNIVARKVVVDGQVYILRAGNLYTVQGQLVK